VFSISRIVWLLLAGAVFTWIIGLNRRDLFARASSVIAVINLALVLVALVLMAVTALRSPVPQSYALDFGTLTYRPAVQSLIGVGFFVFYGHSTVFVVAPRVLRADPSGRALVRGAGAAMIVTVALFLGAVIGAVILRKRDPKADEILPRNLRAQLASAGLDGSGGTHRRQPAGLAARDDVDAAAAWLCARAGAPGANRHYFPYSEQLSVI
jgi:hypothetical protein